MHASEKAAVARMPSLSGLRLGAVSGQFDERDGSLQYWWINLLVSPSVAQCGSSPLSTRPLVGSILASPSWNDGWMVDSRL